MRTQNPQLFEYREARLSTRLLRDLSAPRFGRFGPSLERAFGYVKSHRVALVISTLSILLVWQWHVARMATQRADIAERDMELNARQAIQLSEAMLKAQDAHDRLERSITGYGLPSPN